MTRARFTVTAVALVAIVAPLQAWSQTQLDKLQQGRDTVEVLNQQLDEQTLRERIAASRAAQARSEAELKRATLPTMPFAPPLPQPGAAPAVQLPAPVVAAPPRLPPAASRQPADRGIEDIALLGTMGIDGRYHATFRSGGVTITDIDGGSVLPDGTAVEQVGDGFATVKRRGKSFTVRVTAMPAAAAASPLPPPIMVPGLTTSLVPAQ